MKRHASRGFTLIEVLLGGLVLAVAAAAILGAYVGQVTLNEHARNLSLAIQDANRIIEQIRQQNAVCGGATPAPNAAAPGGVSWDTWLQNAAPAGGGGKSIQPNPALTEHVAVMCQASGGGAVVAACTGPNPIRVTVSVCWLHRRREIGDCDWNAAGTAFVGEDPAESGDALLVDSPAMLTTLVTCRG